MRHGSNEILDAFQLSNREDVAQDSFAREAKCLGQLRVPTGLELIQWNAKVPMSSNGTIDNAQSDRSKIHSDTYPPVVSNSIPRFFHPFRPRNVVENKKCCLSEKGKYYFKIGQCCLFIVMAIDKYVAYRLPLCKNVWQRVLKPPNDYFYSIETELLKVILGNVCK